MDKTRTLSMICKELNNYFCEEKDKIRGKFCVSDGKLHPSVELLDGQYYAIFDSIFNDGVHLYPDDLLKTEPEFDGAIIKMSVKPDFLDLVERIAEWREKNEAANSPNMSPYQSESFGAYSYSKGSGESGGGNAVSWKQQFKSELDEYRKMWGMT